MNVVSNSSPLIALAKIGMLDIIKYDIIIPKAVFDEITRPNKEYTQELYKWGRGELGRRAEEISQRLRGFLTKWNLKGI